jgi:hypothetical protein
MRDPKGQDTSGIATAVQINDWKIELVPLVRQLEMLETGEMGSGDKALRGTTAQSIRRVKSAIAELDALISGAT